jgi:hypothetical protein
LQTAYSEDFLIEKFIDLGRELGHFPVITEVKMKARSDDGFPWHSTFARFGSKQKFAAKVLNYCNGRTGHEDMIALCTPIATVAQDDANKSEKAHPVVPGSSTYRGGGRNLKRGWVSSFRVP